MIICNCRNTPGLEEIAVLINGVWGLIVVFKDYKKENGHEMGCNKKRKKVTSQVSFAIKKNGKWEIRIICWGQKEWYYSLEDWDTPCHPHPQPEVWESTKCWSSVWGWVRKKVAPAMKRNLSSFSLHSKSIFKTSL